MLSRAEFGSRGSCGSTIPTLLLLRVDVFADPVHAVLGRERQREAVLAARKVPRAQDGGDCGYLL